MRPASPRVAVLISCALAAATAGAADRLAGRAVLPADTFAAGPTSGRLIAPSNGRATPFVDKQPVQGFSAVLDNGDGTFLAMADNGFGSLENSSDFHLRVYRIHPHFETRDDERNPLDAIGRLELLDLGNEIRARVAAKLPQATIPHSADGSIDVLSFIELRDPDRKVPFAITRHFTTDRVLTGADFDIESMQRAPDGTLWFGDEFGPFLLHTDATGKVLEAPIPLPDFEKGEGEVRSPQNPLNEEASAVRIMNAVRMHAALNGANTRVVFSPWDVMLDDANPATFVDSRQSSPAGSGVAPASSEVFNVASLKAAGFPVVTWTVNSKERMLELMRLGVNGIITDRSDLLLAAAREFDGNGDGQPDFLTEDGLIDIAKFDAQGHRGSRNLRPENTLPAFEVALDNRMTTLETDNGVSQDRVAVISHDPHIQAQKCRRADGAPYAETDEVLIKDLTAAQIQSQFICDKLFRGPSQINDRAASPVSVAFAASRGLIDRYVMPTTQQLFDFVAFYIDWYASGPGAAAPDAALRAKNARQVRFNIETKINPRREFAERTLDVDAFVDTVAGTIAANGLQSRADVQSFDFRTLLRTHDQYPAIRTVFLFGDFPIFDNPSIAGSDDGTNLQDEHGTNTPWLAGLPWPYRITRASAPFRAERSGGFEGMAISPDGKTLYPLLERPLASLDGAPSPKTLLIHAFDVAGRRYTGDRWQYPLDARGSNIGDFQLFNRSEGLVIERDGSQGELGGFKKVCRIDLGPAGTPVAKSELVDLMRLDNPRRIGGDGALGDVGLGSTFAMPFTTIEDLVVLDAHTIGIVNDNNYPFSVGRHVGAKQPDDNEFVLIRLDEPLKLERKAGGRR